METVITRYPLNSASLFIKYKQHFSYAHSKSFDIIDSGLVLETSDISGWMPFVCKWEKLTETYSQKSKYL